MASGRRCSICSDPEVRHQTDRLLTEGRSFVKIGELVGVTERVVRWHRAQHLSPRLAQAAAASAELNDRALLLRLGDIANDMTAMRQEAVARGDLRAAITAGKAEAALLMDFRTGLGVDSMSVVTALAEVAAVGRGLRQLMTTHPEAVAALIDHLGAESNPHARRMAAGLASGLTGEQPPSALSAPTNDDDIERHPA